MNDLERELRKVIVGGVRFDTFSKLLYSRPTPPCTRWSRSGVVIPRDADDVRAAVARGPRAEVALLPRGGGTSLTGQTVNRALVHGLHRAT